MKLKVILCTLTALPLLSKELSGQQEAADLALSYLQK